MIARLTETLRKLASLPDEADAATHRAGLQELTGEYADAFMLVCDCRQIQLSTLQLQSLRRVEALLEQASEAAAPADWSRVRSEARDALMTLGHSFS